MARKKPKPPAPGPQLLDHIAEQLRPLAVPLEELSLDPKNAKKHGESSVKGIARSLKRFGQVKPIVANAETKVIVAGNGTFMAAKELGWTHLAAVLVKLDPAGQLGYAIADNRTAELAEWNPEILLALLPAIKEDNSDLFDDLLLADLMPKVPVIVEPTPEPVAVVFQVVVDCKNEEDQKRMFERMQGENRKCRLLTT